MAPKWTDWVEIQSMRTEPVDHISQAVSVSAQATRSQIERLTLAMPAIPSLCMICNSKSLDLLEHSRKKQVDVGTLA